MKTLMIASDYDGTIYVDGKISDADHAAIAKFRSLGHKFGLVTGRLRATALQAAATVAHDFVICCSGGVILGKDGQIITANAINHSRHLPALFALAKESGCVNFLIDASTATASFDVANTTPDRITLPPDSRIHEVCFYIPHNTEQGIKHFLDHADPFREDFEIYLNGGSVDMPVRGVSKETGIRTCAAQMGISPENIFAVGDQNNDLPMIRAFTSFAVSNAVPTLKAEATHTCNRIADMIDFILDRYQD